MCKTKKIKLIQTAISILFIIIFNNINCKKNSVIEIPKNPEVIDLTKNYNNPNLNSKTSNSIQDYNQFFLTASNEVLFRGVKDTSEYYLNNGVFTEIEKLPRIIISLDRGLSWKTQNKFKVPSNGLTNTKTNFDFAQLLGNKLYVGVTQSGIKDNLDYRYNYLFRTSTNVNYPNNDFLWDSLLFFPTNDIEAYSGISKSIVSEKFVLSFRHPNSEYIRSPNNFFRLSTNGLNDLNQTAFEADYNSKKYFSVTDVSKIQSNPSLSFLSLTHNSVKFASIGYQIPAEIRNTIRNNLINKVWDGEKDSKTINDYYRNNAKGLFFESDDGISWNTVLNSITNYPLLCIRRIDNNIFVTNSKGEIFKSIDGSYHNWRKVYEFENHTFLKFAHDTDKNIIYAMGSSTESNLKILISFNNGDNWTVHYSGADMIDIDLTYLNGWIYFVGQEKTSGF